jgi:hypothetical protein
MVETRKITVEEIANRRTENNQLQRKTIRIKAKNNNKITFHDIRRFYDKLIDDGQDPNMLSVTAMFNDSIKTIKTFNEDDLKNYDDDDYYKDRAADHTKFDSFFFVDFYFKM